MILYFIAAIVGGSKLWIKKINYYKYSVARGFIHSYKCITN